MSQEPEKRLKMSEDEDEALPSRSLATESIKDQLPEEDYEVNKEDNEVKDEDNEGNEAKYEVNSEETVSNSDDLNEIKSAVTKLVNEVNREELNYEVTPDTDIITVKAASPEKSDINPVLEDGEDIINVKTVNSNTEFIEELNPDSDEDFKAGVLEASFDERTKRPQRRSQVAPSTTNNRGKCPRASIASFAGEYSETDPFGFRLVTSRYAASEEGSNGNTKQAAIRADSVGGGAEEDSVDNNNVDMIPRPTSGYYDGGVVPEGTVPVKYETESSANCCTKCFRKFQSGVIGGLESFFFHYGRVVAKKPGMFIAMSIVITVCASYGMKKFHKENTGTKLWIPEDSSARINTDWMWENYPPDLRFATVILEHDENVLRPDVLQAMFKLHQAIEEITTPEFGVTWSQVCIPLPVVRPPDITDFLFGKKKRRKRRQTESEEEYVDFQEDDFFDDDDFGRELDEGADIFGRGEVDTQDQIGMAEQFSVDQYPSPYCDIVSGMESACFENSILELWANNGAYDLDTQDAIQVLHEDEILDRINYSNVSGVFLRESNFTELLSGISYDSGGLITGAKATAMKFFLRMNATAAKTDPVPERGEPIARKVFEFEGELIKVMLAARDSFPPGLNAYPMVQRSFGDIGGATILGDLAQMGIGYMIVFFYIMFMLGRVNCVEQRIYLSICGIMGVVMGIIVCYGACSAMGLFFGPLHNILPFLLLGIGIDDMFVIVQCFNTLTEEEKELSLTRRFGKTMQHAGVAITITSITDVIAFAIGGTTVLPALKSFCIYASVGIMATYFFQVTFFVACMSLDQRRLENRRNSCCPCYKHSVEWLPNKLSQKSILEAIFKGYSKLLTTWPCKTIVLLATGTLLGFGIWGNVLLRQEFDPTWFIPPGTYLSDFFLKNKEFFPFGGDRVTVYAHDLNYTEDFERLSQLVGKIADQTDIVDEVDSWTVPFNKYLNAHFVPEGEEKYPGFGDEFEDRLTQFLYSPLGAKYLLRFKFENESEPDCGEPSPTLELSHFTFTHRIFPGPEEHIPAMNRIKKIISEANLTTGRVFPLSQGYAAWETDEVIAAELYRNMALAVLCVFLCTLFLLSDILSSFMVLLCVLLSLIDVAGFMHFWGLTIDTVSCVQLIIAIGLCVDYSAHVAHRFLTEQGSRRDRVRATISNIGPAVFNGGFSTFLAFILLATSKSHVFSTFFKIFFLVVTFGMFHGLVFLPVMLALVGPRAHSVDVPLGEVNAVQQPEVNITLNRKEDEDSLEGKEEEEQLGEGGTDPNKYKV